MSARSSRAPAPLSTENRAPAIFVARSKSMMPSAGPEIPVRLRLEVERAQALRAVAPRGCPPRSSRPARVSCGRLGSVSSAASR